MKPLLLRSEDPLADGVVVVRAGVLNPRPESRRGLGTLVVMERRFGLWVDYHRRDADGLTHAHVNDVESGSELVAGSVVLVGNGEGDPAVAEVVAIDDDGVVLVSVLPGPAEQHLHLVPHLHQAG